MTFTKNKSFFKLDNANILLKNIKFSSNYHQKHIQLHHKPSNQQKRNIEDKKHSISYQNAVHILPILSIQTENSQ